MNASPEDGKVVPCFLPPPPGCISWSGDASMHLLTREKVLTMENCIMDGIKTRGPLYIVIVQSRIFSQIVFDISLKKSVEIWLSIVEEF